MSSSLKYCRECGLQLDLGLAQCPRCGTRAGTLFSERNPTPAGAPAKYRERVAEDVNAFRTIERARDRANNALILGLASFFCPGIGIAIGAISIILGAKAVRTLRFYHVEEGRGPGWAGIIIGAIGVLAQFSYLVYVVSQGLPLFGT